MDEKQAGQAVERRARVRISERNGRAKGVTGIALGFRDLYGSVKVGFLDADGNYTGEYTTVSCKSVELVDEATAETPAPRVIAEFRHGVSTDSTDARRREDWLTLTARLVDSDAFERITAPHASEMAADTMLRDAGWQVVGEWEYFARPNVYRATVEKVGSPQCFHGNTPRPDVTGDPIGACRAIRFSEDFGVFNDEGCIYVFDCAVDVANEAARENVEADVTWSKFCTEHAEQPAGTCEDCNSETDEE